VTDSIPPVAIRVARPYATEDELLENELETLTRTSITLLGAQPRPHGLVLRFELMLSSGQVIVRGEGRVIGYKPDLHGGMGGLTLRFTRLDTRSKTVIDRAATLRDRRRPSAGPPFAEIPSMPAPPGADLGGTGGWSAIVSDAASGAYRPSVRPAEEPPTRTNRPSVRPVEEAPTRTNLQIPTAVAASSSPPEPSQEASPAPPRSRDRDELLERLRARSRVLGDDIVQKILARR
jgi:hypothetical protein